MLWQAFLRRFDIEHTFRLFKQTLGWTCPKIRTPEAADRWTWLILAVFTQLRLARPLAADLRRPWEKPTSPDRLTPARVRRDFRHLRPKAACPAGAPKASRPGPGRPPGSKNTRPTPRHATTCTQAANHAPQNDERRSQRTHVRAARVKDQASPTARPPGPLHARAHRRRVAPMDLITCAHTYTSGRTARSPVPAANSSRPPASSPSLGEVWTVDSAKLENS